MSKQNPNNRRKILLGLSGGVVGASQLPKAWTKPMIDSVILPVHAETTDANASSTTANLIGHFYDTVDVTFDGKGSASQAFLAGDATTGKGLLDRSLSVLVSDANAGKPSPSFIAELCIDSPDGVSFTAQFLYISKYGYFWEGSGTIGGGPANFSLTAGCSAPNGVIEVTKTDAGGATYSIDIIGLLSNGILPVKPGCPKKPEKQLCPETK